MSRFQVIVVGSGHAGVESALAAARLGAETLLLTMSADQIGTMSCNPAIGGLGKSQLAKEIDVLGGEMCRTADLCAMQYRVLNEKKGVAVRASRVQVDRHAYRERMKWVVESQKGLSLMQGQAAKLLFNENKLVGIETSLGLKLFSPNIVLTTGTFMNGKAHIGLKNFASGRAGEPPSVGLSDYLRSLGVRIGRFKTGTVPRVDGRSIDYSKLEAQNSHSHCQSLSFFSKSKRMDLEPAFIGYTNHKTHELIRGGLDDSPLYSGIIESKGPRYCPSVEDKIVRFADKDRHQIFLEREGRNTWEVYVGGLSTSLPYETQDAFLKSIPGLEAVKIIRPGYAIEYDYIDATQLNDRLELKELPGLFVAGQVNGTSGYEEAAAQGFYAGVNAAFRALEREPFRLSRAESYIGVLVDDLTRIKSSEPYRMMTSRAEHRLALREDNIPDRLSRHAHQLGILASSDLLKLERWTQAKVELREKFRSKRVPLSEALNNYLSEKEESAFKNAPSIEEVLRRPKVDQGVFKFLSDEWFAESSDQFLWESTAYDIRYEGYIRQAESQMRQLQRMKNLKIPDGFDFSKVRGLNREAIESLSQMRPKNLDEATGLEGVSPSALTALAIFLSRKGDEISEQKDACISV